MVECLEDHLELYPTYGYDAQVSAWMQVQGVKDMARIYLNLVPRTEGKDLGWSVGAFHIQQWTHAGRDGSDWMEDGKKLHAEKKPLAGWLMLDLAAKLYDGGGFVNFPIKAQIQSIQQSWFTNEAWLSSLKKLLPDQKVVYAASLFIRDGAALLMRFETTTEISLKDMQSRCLHIATTLKPALKGVVGVVQKYDGLWQRPFPYLMVLYQSPCGENPQPWSHFHFEFLPPSRRIDRLKYLAGTELGGGIFANDTLPEEKAKELQAVEVFLD